jgi:hypothetical protein
VNKTQASLMSLVAAIPGGLLAYGMIMSFLQYSEKSPLSFKVISGMSLVMGLLLALLPFAILAFGGPRTVKAIEPSAKDSLAVSAANSAVSGEYVETEALDDLEVAGEAQDDFELGEGLEATEFVDDDAFADAPAEHEAHLDDLETFEEMPVDDIGDEPELDQMETFDNLQLEELEEDFPPEDTKKKKKK